MESFGCRGRGGRGSRGPGLRKATGGNYRRWLDSGASPNTRVLQSPRTALLNLALHPLPRPSQPTTLTTHPATLQSCIPASTITSSSFFSLETPVLERQVLSPIHDTTYIFIPMPFVQRIVMSLTSFRRRYLHRELH